MGQSGTVGPGLAPDPGPAGRVKICELVKKACTDADFVERHLPDDGPDRKILYEDPQLGFCILGHVNQGASFFFTLAAPATGALT